MSKAEETRFLILNTVAELLNKNSICDINVSQICTACQITRPTFYRYFPCKEDVLTWYMDDILTQTLGQIGILLSFHEGHTLWYETLKKHQAFYHGHWKNCDYDLLQAYLFAEIRESCLSLLTNHKHLQPDTTLTFQVNALSMVTSMLTMQWISQDMEQSPEYLAGLLHTVIPADLLQIMENGIQGKGD